MTVSAPWALNLCFWISVAVYRIAYMRGLRDGKRLMGKTTNSDHTGNL